MKDKKLTFGERLLAHVPWLTMMILITIESSIKGFKLPQLGLHIEDKIVHYLIFGVLGWLLIRGMFMETMRWVRKNKYWIVSILGLLFAFSDEWHQSMVPGRDASIWDWLADALGIITFVYYFYLRQRQKKA